MQLLMRRPEVEGFISIAPPANLYDFSFLAPCPSSGLIVHGEKDAVVPPKDVNTLVEKLKTQKGIVIDQQVIPGANHFFDAKLRAADGKPSRPISTCASPTCAKPSMNAYVALLRAVNVGGTGKLPMSDLKGLCEGRDSSRSGPTSRAATSSFEPGAEAPVKAALETALEAYAGEARRRAGAHRGRDDASPRRQSLSKGCAWAMIDRESDGRFIASIPDLGDLAAYGGTDKMRWLMLPS